MHVQIKLPEPCNADWNDMKPNADGRFCNHCCKTVIDFTSWKPEAIANYLLIHADEKPCGRFQTKHLNTNIEVKEHLIIQIEKWHAPIWNKWIAVIIVCFAIFSTACNDRTSTKLPQKSTNVVASTDSAIKNPQILGEYTVNTPPQLDTLPLPPKTATPKNIKRASALKGEITESFQESHVLGGVPVMEPAPVIKMLVKDTFIGPQPDTNALTENK